MEIYHDTQRGDYFRVVSDGPDDEGLLDIAFADTAEGLHEIGDLAIDGWIDARMLAEGLQTGRFVQEGIQIGYKLGQVVMTAAVADEPEIVAAIPEILQRHALCDWGDVCAEDAQANEQALKYGSRLLSSYHVNGRKVWIITEADRSATTVLFPEDY